MKVLVGQLDAQHCALEIWQDSSCEYRDCLHFSSDSNKGGELQDFLQSDAFRADFDEIVFSLFTEQSTLLPSHLFEASDTQSIYKLSFGELPEGCEVFKDKVLEQRLINIYGFDQALHGIITTNFPKAQLQHEGSIALKALQARKYSRLTLKVFVHQEHFMLVMCQEAKLFHFNTGSYQNSDDIVYHLANLIKKEGLEDKELDCFFQLVIGTETESNIAQELMASGQKLSIFKKVRWKEHKQWLTLSQLLCA